ncbi:MAG: type II toxin-antitoxin system Phd/YefM family antitoxin [Candidatus Omnitrophica bacterium]|nr:type II toxin-antitoxin system Phd/YefM family antitoxin [Candidatus Omnitrophota bacterium]
MSKDIPITEARHELTSLPKRLVKSHEAVTVTRRGKPVLAILRWEVYEAILETLEILGDKKMMEALRRGIKEARAGKGIPWEQAKSTLNL